MAPRTKHPREDEQFALETIAAVEGIASCRWLDPGAGPTPDLELRLNDGRIVAVEITMSTDDAARSLRAEFDGRRWRKPELRCEWGVRLSDLSPQGRGRRRDVPALIDKLVPVLRQIEAIGGEHEVMRRTANQQVAHLGPPEWDRIGITNCDPSGGNTGGGVRTWIATGAGGLVETVDALVDTVQARIDAKIAKGQLAELPSPEWLVVVLDGGLATMQLEDGFGAAGSPRRPAAVQTITFPGIDEVWVVGQCFGRSEHRAALRLFASGVPWRWQIVEYSARRAIQPS